MRSLDYLVASWTASPIEMSEKIGWIDKNRTLGVYFLEKSFYINIRDPFCESACWIFLQPNFPQGKSFF